MIECGLFDGCFNGRSSATLGGENTGAPRYIRWVRGETRDVTFYTDICLDNARGHPGRKVAWLLEPPSLHDGHYREAERLEAVFDYILTYDRGLIAKHDITKWLYYPLGGTWLADKDTGYHEKSDMVSMIASFKVGAVGHKLRHEIARRFAGRIDVMGTGYRKIPSKLEGLAPYRYSIVVESCQLEDYFSEKVVDAFLCGTVPIYWGSPALDQTFSPGGFLTFDNLDELEMILDAVVSRQDYASRWDDVVDNYMSALAYTCAEDWIFEHYPQVFE